MYDESWKEVPCKLSWRGLSPNGYSNINGKGAHRIAWEEAYGPIPDGMEVCHHCDVRNCKEPLHLFLDTHQGNMQDAGRKGKLKGCIKNQNTDKTHCIHGHEFTPENTGVDRLWRYCKTCKRNRPKGR